MFGLVLTGLATVFCHFMLLTIVPTMSFGWACVWLIVIGFVWTYAFFYLNSRLLLSDDEYPLVTE